MVCQYSCWLGVVECNKGDKEDEKEEEDNSTIFLSFSSSHTTTACRGEGGDTTQKQGEDQLPDITRTRIDGKDNKDSREEKDDKALLLYSVTIY